MGTGILTAICLSMALSQGSDVFHTNRRDHQIPVNVDDSQRSAYREFLLYESTDQGRTWRQAGVIPATKAGFAYYAAGDGAFWFQVATVSKAGVQSPSDQEIMKGPAHLKMVIDTTKPVVKSFQATRVGDEVAVTWDIQEDHPDLGRDGVRLEFRVKDALVESWKAVPIQGQGMKGQLAFSPGTKQAVIMRITVRDLAGNESFSVAEIAGTVVAAGYVGQAPAVAPLDLPVFPKQPMDDVKKPVLPLPPPAGVIEPKPMVAGGGAVLPPPNALPPPVGVALPGAPEKVADSRTPPPMPQPEVLKTSSPHGPDGIQDIKPLAHATPARKQLPMLQYVNQHLVKLQYEIKRQGPSGIGGIQIWLTRDDGDTWTPYAEVKDLGNEAVQGRQERDFEFRDKYDAPFPDAVYGLILVVKNRAGLGREPRPGDAPEIRIEIDTKAPVAQLFKPTLDPQNPTQLLLKWSAQDKNLADTPIDLEYAEKRDGPWRPIEQNLKNSGRYTNQFVTGDYSWKIPPGTPVQVYLRLRVRDKAGNESIAVTGEPQFVDLVEPEGALIGVVPQTKRP